MLPKWKHRKTMLVLSFLMVSLYDMNEREVRSMALNDNIKKIREEKMENHVILLGKKQNPYPYIKACDIYVQPSRYEGKSVAVREAQLIKKPVIITNYSTAKSQLENEIDGLIVPMENKDCADQMVEIIQDVEKLRKISEACSKRDYSNKREVQKLYKLFE